MTASRKPALLWSDFASAAHTPDLRIQCARVFEVEVATTLEQAATLIPRIEPSVLCFDFDHPDQNRLRGMQVIKKAHARLPILMLTLDHSESLAVWAFRARVWNYLVKPISRAEFDENLDALASIGSRASPPRVAQSLVAALPDDLPVEPVESRVARLQPALHYVKQHFHEKIAEAAVADCCGMTRFSFSRNFRAAFGLTFREYLLRLRITEARRLLVDGRPTVTDVAYAVGFNDASHFARMFRRYARVLPSEYREAMRLADREAVALNDDPSLMPRRRATDQLKVDRRRRWR